MNRLIAYRSYSWILLLIPIYLFIFLKLDSFHVRLWDESYFAVHATEMLLNDSWLIPYFDGEPVNGGTKPPIQNWLQIVFMKMIGINELALRLPSAIATGVSVLLVFHWSRRYFGEVAAWASSMVLLTFSGYIHFHTGRGMEADALLALCMLMQVMLFGAYLKSKRDLWLIMLGILVGFSFLVKSIAGFLFLPGIVGYLLIFDRELMKNLLRKRQFYISLGLAFLIPSTFVLVREMNYPGFVSFIFDRHVGKISESQGFYTSPFHYLKILVSDRYLMWSPLALGAAVYCVTTREPLSRMMAVVTFTFLILLNLVSTKYEHYLNPVAPLFAILIGIAASKALATMDSKRIIAVFIAEFILPGSVMFTKAQSNYMDQGQIADEMSAKYLHRAIRKGKDLDGIKVMHEGFNAALVYYKHRYASLNQEIKLENWDIVVGDKVLTCSAVHHNGIHQKFVVDTIDQLENAIVYEIKAKRDE